MIKNSKNITYELRYNEKVYFGELTLSDSAGYGLFSEAWDEKPGNMLDLNIKNRQ